MRKVSSRGIGIGALALLAWAWGGPESGARAEDRPKTSSTVKVPAQGGEGLEPVPGAPPAVTPSLESRPVPATLGPLPSRTRASASRLRALSTADGEASLEVDGRPETVRPGSRLGGDTVKSVSPGRLVLDRPATGTKPAALVVVTFDAAGRAKEQVFWTSDPAASAIPEANRP